MRLFLAWVLLLQAEDLDLLIKKFEEEKRLPPADRAATLKKIATLATEPAVAFLEKVVEGDREEAVRLDALWYLATVGGERGHQRALAAARQEATPQPLRLRAIQALAEIRSKEGLGVIAAIARNRNPGNKLREPAWTALAKYPYAEAEALWAEALADPEPAFRGFAFRALAPLKEPRVLERAKKVLEDAAEIPPAKAGAVAVWAALGGPEALPVLLSALQNRESGLRAQVFRALAPYRDPKARDQARRSLEDPAEPMSVKSAAAEVWMPADGPEAVKVLLSTATFTDADYRKRLAAALGAVTDEKSAELLFDAFRTHTPTARALVARALGKIRHPRALEVLEAALREREPAIHAAAIEAIAERRDKRSEEILHREARRGETDAAAAAIRALSAYPTESTLKLLAALTTHRSIEVRVLAIESIAETRTPEGFEVLRKVIESREWQLRAAAIRALGKIRMKESVDLLVARLGKEDGRLLVDIAEALKGLTGKSLGYAQGHWQDWWKANRETFAFPDRGRGIAAGAAGVTVTYHGVPVLSKRMAFCLDVSGSMDAKQGNETRLDQAKKELVKVLQGLDATAFVNLVFFNDQVEAWQKRLVPARPNLDAAVRRVNSQRAVGGTNIFDTLETVFQDPTVDTIYLLSDGAPTAGRIVTSEQILREIARLNRSRQVVIHTISLGASPFMKQLAEQNGGQYVEKK